MENQMNDVDEAYEQMESHLIEVRDYNTAFIKSLNLNFNEMRELFCNELMDDDISIISKIEKCESPKGFKPIFTYYCKTFTPIYVNQYNDYEDYYEGTIYFHYRGQCYKFDYTC